MLQGFVGFGEFLVELPELQDGLPFVVLLKDVWFFILEFDIRASFGVGSDVCLRIGFVGAVSEDACIADGGLPVLAEESLLARVIVVFGWFFCFLLQDVCVSKPSE